MKRFYIFFALILLAGPAAAFKPVQIDPLKPVELLPDEEFDRQTQEFYEDPLQDPLLEYSIRLPKGWSKSKTFRIEDMVAVSKILDVLGTVARYDGPPQLTERSYITVDAMILESEITAEQWYVGNLLKEGYTPQGMTVRSDQEVEALYVEVRNGETFGVRMIARINGDRLVVVRYFVTQERYNDERQMMAQVIRSFTLENPAPPQIETRKTYSFLDQSFYDYPVSWNLIQINNHSIDRMRSAVESVNQIGQLNGKIEIRAISKLLETKLSDEVKKFVENIDIEGYFLGEFIEGLTFNVQEEMIYHGTEAYALTPYSNGMMPYEFWVSIMENDDYYYIVTLLTPSRRKDFFIWTKNNEALKVVNASVRRYDNAKNVYDE